VVERRERLGLAREPAQTLRITGEEIGQDLDGDVAIEPGIAGSIDFAHPASTEWRDEFIGAETSTAGQS
jgi:hypothetical protein